MLHQQTCFLPTKQLYTLPNSEAYTQAKQARLAELDAQYASKNTKEKWALLITQLSSSLQSAHMPSLENTPISLHDYQTMLAAFKTKREGTTHSLYNLSLEQCVNYFEDFLFLYQTQDERFQLKNDQKKSLLLSIHEVILGACETGINGRFYTALQDFQKQADWILSELYKTRCEAIRLLHAQYIAQNAILEGFNIHVYDHLIELANQHHFGIPKKEIIWDVFGNHIDKEKINTFFNQHFSKITETYEQQVTDSLTRHYMAELCDILSLTGHTWHEPVRLTAKQAADLTRSLECHFQTLPTDFISTLYEDTDIELDDEGMVILIIKSKKDVTQLIQAALFNELLAKQCFVSIEQVDEHDDIKKIVKLPSPLRVEDILDVHHRLKQPTLNADNLQPLIQTLRYYPELALQHLIQQPQHAAEIVAYLGHDVYFKDQAVAILNTSLCAAIDTGDENTIRQLAKNLFDLIGPETNYLHTLSAPIFSHAITAKYLLEKDGLLLSQLSDDLRQDPELFATAKTQNEYVDFYLMSDERFAAEGQKRIQQLPSSVIQEVIPPNLFSFTTPSHAAIEQIMSLDILYELLTQEHIMTDAFLEKSRHFNPLWLSYVIKYRQTNHLPALPFCADAHTGKKLQQFLLDWIRFDPAHENLLSDANEYDAMQLDADQPAFYPGQWIDRNTLVSNTWKNNLVLNLHHDALDWKRKAYAKTTIEQRTQYDHPLNALPHLATATNWFEAFVQYQQYESLPSRRWQRLFNACIEFGNMVFSALKIALVCCVTYYVFPPLFLFVDLYFLPLAFITAVLFLSNLMYFQEPYITTLCEILCYAITLDAQFLIGAIRLCCKELYHAGLALWHALDGVVLLWELSMAALFGQKIALNTTTTKETCDYIIARLQMIHEPSAQQKAHILQQLLVCMQQDSQASGVLLETLLKKTYSIDYQGKTYEVSFDAVAAKSRSHTASFSLDSSLFSYGFFRTTSSDILTDFATDNVSAAAMAA